MRLIDLQSGKPLNINDRVVTFTGEIGRLVEVTPPPDNFRTGVVGVIVQGSSFTREMTPSVIGAKFCDGTDVA